MSANKKELHEKEGAYLILAINNAYLLTKAFVFQVIEHIPNCHVTRNFIA